MAEESTVADLPVMELTEIEEIGAVEPVHKRIATSPRGGADESSENPRPASSKFGAPATTTDENSSSFGRPRRSEVRLSKEGTAPPPSASRRAGSLTRQSTLSALRMAPKRVLPKMRVSVDFQQQSRQIAKQLKQRDQDRVWTIDPRDSRILSFWDGMTTLALIYSAPRCMLLTVHPHLQTPIHASYHASPLHIHADELAYPCISTLRL